MSREDILVTIRCTTYNHGPYLRQCLDGFVHQITNFRFEAFVHDDASTDDSAEIIREYALAYPDIIKPYFESENLYQKRDGRFVDITYDKQFLSAKYIALCEGDDYWTDFHKLQKQVDYMEAHPDCAMCFGNAIEHWEDGAKPDKLFSQLESRDYSGVELSDKWIVPTASILFRQKVLDNPLFKTYSNDRKIMAGDLPLCLCCASQGTIHAFTDVFCVYRRVPKGFWRSLDSAGRIRMGYDRIELFRIFGHKYRKSTLSMALYHFQRAWQLAKDEGNLERRREAKKNILRLAITYPDIGIKHFMKIIKEKIGG